MPVHSLLTRIQAVAKAALTAPGKNTLSLPYVNARKMRGPEIESALRSHPAFGPVIRLKYSTASPTKIETGS